MKSEIWTDPWPKTERTVDESLGVLLFTFFSASGREGGGSDSGAVMESVLTCEFCLVGVRRCLEEIFELETMRSLVTPLSEIFSSTRKRPNENRASRRRAVGRKFLGVTLRSWLLAVNCNNTAIIVLQEQERSSNHIHTLIYNQRSRKTIPICALGAYHRATSSSQSLRDFGTQHRRFPVLRNRVRVHDKVAPIWSEGRFRHSAYMVISHSHRSNGTPTYCNTD